MIFYALAIGGLSAAYALALLMLRNGLRNITSVTAAEQPKVSIIVAARNEQKNISRCLQAILSQTYPKDKLEVLVVDDRSTDGTAEIVERVANANHQIRLLRITDRDPDFAPKKRAIDFGIRHASGDIIFTTDADCQPGPEWIAEMVKHFAAGVGMVAGYNPYIVRTADSLFQKMMALDYFAMACVAAASAGLNFPVSCSGGNLAYRKQVYLEVGGFQNRRRWISGDDDFFLEKLRQTRAWKIHYAVAPQTHVPTTPPENFREFVNQRIRYASKGAHYSKPVALVLVGVYLCNLLLLAGVVVSFFQPKILASVAPAYFVKVISEFWFLWRGQRLFQTRHSLLAFFLTALTHPLYIAVMGSLGTFLNFKWKGETYPPQLRQPSTQRSTLKKRFTHA